MVKILILKTEPSLYLIGKMTELDEEPSLLIENCHSIAPDGTLSPYPLHTDQRDLFLTSDLTLTILDPSASVADAYKRLVS